MLAKRAGTGKTSDNYSGIVPDRMIVTNEITVLLVLRKENDWMTAFQIEVGVAKMRGDETRSVQLTGGLRQLINNGLVEEQTFKDTKTRRTVKKYLLTPKGEQSADLFYQLFLLWKTS